MQLKRVTLILLLSLCISTFAQEKGLEIDILSRYYTQDGDHSAVTGGEGTEELDAMGPIFLVQYASPTNWTYSGEFGVENVTSASLDRIDYYESAPGVNVSSASRKDNRAFVSLGATHQMNQHALGVSLGFSGEYDYRSLNGGLNWSVDLNQKNSTLSTKIQYYSDTIDQIDITGYNEGTADRKTMDISLGWSQVFSRSLVGSVEISRSDQSGLLSSPFQEVHLENGTIIAEVLPDARERDALRFQLNFAFSPKVIQRSYYRYYTDSWDIDSHTLESETHFLLPLKGKNWIYPLFRYYTQEGTSHFGLRGTQTGEEPYMTADYDLSTFNSFKAGIGFSRNLEKSGFSRWSIRLTYYDRDDGLNSISLSGGFGWSF